MNGFDQFKSGDYLKKKSWQAAPATERRTGKGGREGGGGSGRSHPSCSQYWESFFLGIKKCKYKSEILRLALWKNK